MVVTSESLIVYSIDNHHQTATAHSTKDIALCVLQLPAWSSIRGSHHHLVQSHIQFPSPLGPNDRPLNRPDPDLTLLALDIHYIVEAPLEREPELVQHAMFIPVSTIKQHIDSVSGSPHPQPQAGASPWRVSVVVPWSDWGPSGTHLVHLDSRSPCHLSPMGSACAVTQRRRDASGNPFMSTLVFDVHPWACPDSPHAEERRRILRLAGSDAGADALLGGAAFAESIRTTFPFDVTRRDIPLTPDDAHPTVVLTEDGLLLVVCPKLAFVTLVRVVVDLRVSRRPVFDSFGANVFGWHQCCVRTARAQSHKYIVMPLLVGGWDERQILLFPAVS